MTSLEPADVVLVALPWARRDLPSAALGTLTAFLRQQRPALRVRSVHAYLQVAADIGDDPYDTISSSGIQVGELVNAAVLYPAKAADALAHCAAQLSAEVAAELDLPRVVRAVTARIDWLADEIARSARVVGMTSGSGQLLLNLALARAIKARNPEVVTVFGGVAVSGRIGPSVLRVYPFVDYVVRGEGELPLLGLVDALGAAAGAKAVSGPGVASNGGAPAARAAEEVTNLDTLPQPDYDEYAELADELGVEWMIAIEGSRGCWWDRTARTGDAKDTCYFCTLDGEHGGYRAKGVRRLASEVSTLVERYKKTRLLFVDNIVRHEGLGQLAAELVASGKHLDFFHEVRASVPPRDLLTLWEAGLRRAQVGIEALSNSMLRRINKGTSVIQNLQIMRLMRELGIESYSNLISEFPGSTDEEARETCETIESYALSFQPLSVSRFHLQQSSTVDRLPERFGITNVRNRGWFRHGIPEEDLSRLELFDLECDHTLPRADWSAVAAMCARWASAYAKSQGPSLIYRDGITFLNIEDERFGELRTVTLEGLARDLYLECMEIRMIGHLVRRAAARFAASEAEVREILAELCEHRLVYTERDRYLSLAVATTPHLAAARIRASFAADDGLASDHAKRAPSARQPSQRRSITTVLASRRTSSSPSTMSTT